MSTAKVLTIGARLILLALCPIQRLVDRPHHTHVFCNEQAVALLARDGLTAEAAFLSRYLAQLNAGVLWADEGWKNVSHYFNPGTRKGLWEFNTAVYEFLRYTRTAFVQARRHDVTNAMFNLGAAAHLVQDLCVPHHATGQVFHGHQEYEAWVQQHHLAFSAREAVDYTPPRKIFQWVTGNAEIAADFLPLTDPGAAGTNFTKATAVLLPLAQRSTAAFFAYFLRQSGLMAVWQPIAC